MQNPYDVNASADRAVMGGEAASTAAGFPNPRPQAGMRTASNLIAVAKAQLEASRPTPAPREPVFGFNPETKQFFSAGQTWDSNLSELEARDRAGFFDVNNAQLPAGFQPVTGSYVRGWTAKERANLGFVDDVQRSLGQQVYGAGSAMRDIPGLGGIGQSVQDYGGNIVGNNPARVNSLGEIIDSPFAAAQQVVADIGVQLPLMAAGGAAGAAAGSWAGPAGALVGGAIGSLAPLAATEYGNIRQEQRNQGIEDKTSAAVSATGQAALERFLGPEARILSRAPIDLLKSSAVKSIARGAAEEGVTEMGQQALGRWGAHKDLGSQQAIDEYLFSGAMGALGGGVMGGGHYGVQKMLGAPSQPQPPAGIAPPAAPATTPPAVSAPSTLGAPATLLDRDRSAEQAARWAQPPVPENPSLQSLLTAGAVGQQWQDLQAQQAGANAQASMVAEDVGSQAAQMLDQKRRQMVSSGDAAARVGEMWQQNPAAQAPAQNVSPAAYQAGQQWQDLQAQQLGDMLDNPAGNEAELARTLEAAAGNPKVASQVNPQASPTSPLPSGTRPTSSTWSPKAAPVAGEVSSIADRPAPPKVQQPAQPAAAAGKGAGVSQPTQVATKTESDLGLDELPSAPAAPASGKRPMVRRAEMSKSQLKSLAAALDNDEEARTDALSDKAATLMEKIHALTKARDDLLSKFSSGRVYYRDKTGKMRRESSRKMKLDLHSVPREKAEANLEGIYSQFDEQLRHVTGQLHKAFYALEQEVGTNNIQAAQQLSKKTAEGGTQVSAAALFSREFRDYTDNIISADNPMAGSLTKDIRDRRELGDFAMTKLAELAARGWSMSNKSKTKWTGAHAVLMKIRMHGGNPYTAHLATRLSEFLKLSEKEGMAPVKMRFYTAQGEALVSENTTEWGPEKYPGKPGTVAFYDPKTHTVHVSEGGNKPGILMHELLHAALAGYIHKNANTPAVKALEALRKHVVAALKKDAKGVDKSVLDAISAPTAGIHEFLSYGLTDLPLQQAMAKIEASQNEAVTSFIKDTWNAFVAVVRKIMGLPPVYQSVLDQYMHVTGDLLDKGYNEDYAGKSTLNAAKTGYDKLAAFWKALAGSGNNTLFQFQKMDDSYGKPKRAFTMEEILAKYMPTGWYVEVPSETRLDRMKPPSGGKTVAGWHLMGQHGSGWILEDDKGQITVQTPGMTQGSGEGMRVLQTALAYAFYNGKVFINEDPLFSMSDSAVLRYTEAMFSAALKYGTTSFMDPSRRQRDPDARTSEEPVEDDFRFNLGKWKQEPEKNGEKAFLHNVNLMARMLADNAMEKFPELRSATFYPDEGFRDHRGEPLEGLTSTQKRAILAENVASMSEGSAIRMGREMQDETVGSEQDLQVGTAQIQELLYASAYQGPATASGLPIMPNGMVNTSALDLRRYSPKTAWLEPVFRAVLPMVYGANPKLAQQGAKWAADMKAKLQKASPTLAAKLSLLNPDFNIAPELADFIDDFKSGRHAPTTSANEFGKWVESAKDAEIIEVFNYMDALHSAPNTAAPAGMPDHVRIKVKDALAALQAQIASIDPDSDVGLAYAEMKPSEMLTHALQLSAVNSTGFGAKEDRVLAGRMHRISEDEVVSPAGPGGIMRTGRFHPVYDKKGGTDIVKWVHETMAKSEPNADTSRVARMDQYDKTTGDISFRELTTAKGLLTDKTLGAQARSTVAASFLNTVSILSNAVATRKLTEEVAAHGAANGYVFADQQALEKHTGAPTHVYNMSERETDNPVVAAAYRKPGTWVKLPINKGFGDLSGKVVPGPVWSRINDSINRKPVVPAKAYNDMMRIFKGAKTKYNPPTILTNIMGNFTLAYMNNLSRTAVADALKLYLTYKTMPGKLSKEELAIMSAFHASGATLGDWSTAEVKQIMYEAMVAKSPVSEVGFLNSMLEWAGYHGSVVERAAKMAKQKGLKLDDVMSDVYATGDNMFRLAAFMSKYGELQTTNPDMSAEERLKAAGRAAKEQFLDYDTDSRAVNAMRQTFLPFVSFTYAYGKRLADIALHQPWKLSALALAYTIASSAMTAAVGEDYDEEEEKRRRKAAGMDDTTWFGAYKNVRLWRNDKGQDVYFDAARWFMPTPLDFKDNPNGFLGMHSFPSALTPNNPMMTAFMYMYGFDPYTGKTITNETRTTPEHLAEVAKKTAGVFAPPLATKAVTAPTPKPGVLGEEESYYTYYARAFALPVKAVSDKQAQRDAQMEVSAVTKAYDKEIYSVHRMRRIGRITAEEHKEQIQELLRRKQEEIAELRKVE